VLLVGGAALHAWIDSESDGPRRATRAQGAGEQGELLVVADPWAHVFVDGERRETTPFATPLQLSAGTHHVRLEHPAAVPERREVELRAGERIVLDVTMKLQDHFPDAGAESLRSDAGAAP
jgi:serine/threonine-protein kinase